jgi:cytoskeletal protein RodZ
MKPDLKQYRKWLPWIVAGIVAFFMIAGTATLFMIVGTAISSWHASDSHSTSATSTTRPSASASASATASTSAAAAPETGPDTSTTPQGPQPPEGVTFEVSPGPNGDIVTASYKLQENFTAGLTKDTARYKTVEVLKYAQSAYPKLAEVDVHVTADMKDTYGNTSVGQVATLVYSRDSLDKINWNNIDPADIWNVPIADPIYIHHDLLY